MQPDTTLRAAGAIEVRPGGQRTGLRLLAIVVSFAHMMATIGEFTAGDWYALPVAAGTTLLIDLAIWQLLSAVASAWQAGDRRGASAPALLLLLALGLAVGLNYGYLWQHRPPAMEPWLAGLIAGGIAIFIPGIIAVSALLDAQEATRASTLRQDATELRTLRDEVTRLRELEATAANLLPDAQDAARLRGELVDIRAALDAARASEAQTRATIGELRAELEAARAGQGIDIKALAREFAAAGVTTPIIARGVGRPESTVRGWVKSEKGDAG